MGSIALLPRDLTIEYCWKAILARRHDPFGTVLGTLRRRLAEGAYPPGVALAIVDLAAEFQFSTTPIREALAWLAGEGLINDLRGKGYCCWRIEVEDLAALYDLHELYVGEALRRIGGAAHLASREVPVAVLDRPLDERPSYKDLIGATAAAFGRLVSATANPVLIQAHASLAVRLGNVRRAEARVFEDLEEELRRLNSQSWQEYSEMDRLIGIYHDRRRVSAPNIHRALLGSEI